MNAVEKLVPAEHFLASSTTAPAIALDQFRADMDGVLELSDPYGR